MELTWFYCVFVDIWRTVFSSYTTTDDLPEIVVYSRYTESILFTNSLKHSSINVLHKMFLYFMKSCKCLRPSNNMCSFPEGLQYLWLIYAFVCVSVIVRNLHLSLKLKIVAIRCRFFQFRNRPKRKGKRLSVCSFGRRTMRLFHPGMEWKILAHK